MPSVAVFQMTVCKVEDPAEKGNEHAALVHVAHAVVDGGNYG